MERGKQICKILKDIRRQIADENGIEFITSECSHKGDCAGTCPKCEAEVRYLESQLARRRVAGRATRLVGVSLGLAAVAPALMSCEPLVTMGDVEGPGGQLDGMIEGPMLPEVGDPAIPDNVNLGENLVFDLIPRDVFMHMFSQGGWQEEAVYDVFPGGKHGEDILSKIEDYRHRRYAVKSDDQLVEYVASKEDPTRMELKPKAFCFFWDANSLVIGTSGSETVFTVASINEEEMVCYGEVFSPVMSPDAFMGKYVFRHVDDQTVAGWDAQAGQSEEE